MTLVETIIRDEDDNIHRYTPLSAKITQYGIKRPDTARFKYSIQSRVKQNDTLSYIQDIISLNFLSACWNFQMSAKDDRGFNLDGEDLDSSRFDRVRSGRFKGQYALNFTAQNQGVEVPTTDEMEKRIDLSKQFDILIWFTPQMDQFISGNNEPILFSKYDSTNGGIEIGISNENRDNDNADNEWRCFARVGSGSNTEAINGDSVEIVLSQGITNTPFRSMLLRCWRDEDDVIRLSVNGEQDAEFTMEGDLNNSSRPIVFGNGNGSNDHFKGWIHSVRVYSGNYLNQIEINRIYGAKASPFIMKFAGKIINVNDKQSPKTIECRSFGDLLNKQELTEDLYDNADASDLRTGNVYDESSDILPMLKDMANLIDSDIQIRTKEELITLTPPSEILGSGSFIDILKTLLLSSDRSFFITPRKILIIEDADGINTDFVFKQGGTGVFHYDITQSEELVFDTASSVLVYGFNNIVGTSDKADDRTDIDKNKLVVVYAPYIKNINTLNTLAQKIKNDLNNNTIRYEIKAPALINFIRPLQNVGVINSIKKFDRSIGIAGIEYNFPKGQTLINVGVNPFDLYDTDGESIREIKGITNTLRASTGGSTAATNTAPQIVISSPVNGATITNGTTITFTASATDEEDDNDDLTDEITWKYGSTAINGSGEVTATLPSGTHTITASVTDSGNLTTTKTVEITVGIAVPTALGAVSSTLSGRSISLSWTDFDDADSYKIFRSIGDSDSFSELTTSTTNSYTDTTLECDDAGEQIYYKVRATNSGGDSADSSLTSKTLPDLPDRPGDVDVVRGNLPDGVLVIKIERNDDLDPIDVYRSTSSSTDGTRIAQNVTDDTDDREDVAAIPIPATNTDYIYIYDDGLVSGQTYYYRAYSINGGCRSTARSGDQSPNRG